ncbi:obscurin-like [Artemia franciscana]
MPEFVAPEIANGEGVGTPADIWSVGVITYLLLSGISPFRGGNDRETLSNVQKGQINFDVDAFSSVSCEAKDFIAKLLVFQGAGRLNVRDALEHPWLKTADREMNDSVPIPTDRLKSYYLRLKEWYSNASCRTWFRRRPLSGAFIDPSKMVYPPGESNTPRGTPARENGEKGPIRVEVNGYDRPDYQVEVISSESQYQMGPDTFLLPLRDPNFPARLRRYMKVAQQRSPTFTLRLNEHNFDKSLPIIRERRRFTDIMDEEIDDEKKNRINRYVTDRSFSPTARRLRHEVGTRLECANQAEAIIEAQRHGKVPFFREKPKTVAIVEDKPIEMSCFVVGDPKPRVEWYKNEVMLLPGSRISIKEDDKGRSILRFESAMSQDVGIYKVVARNDSGQVTARARLVIGDLPSQPDSPDVSCYSDTEVLLKWKVPKDDGNSPILCYNLQYRGTGETEWRDVANNIDHEFYLVRELKGLHPYIFRISARNAFGWSEKSIPSETVTTRETGAPPVQITRAMQLTLQQLTESGKTIETDQGKSISLDYSAETNPVELHDNPPTEDYSFIAEIARGQFSFIAKCVRKSTDTIYTAKALSRNDEDAAKAEVEKMRTLRHERVATLIEAYTMPSHYIMILEKLQGMDVLTYLSNLHEYTEQMVATIVNQVLDALQYLHWRGLGYLDLQFDNIVLTSSRTVDVKLVDFGCAEPVSKLGTLVKQKGLLEYTAPEVLAEEPAYPQSDIWSLGAMTYTLLSGVSPFKGETNEETRQNIVFVRYRFEPLHKEITMEATRFLMLIFKRAPLKRPATEECLENRWLQPTEFMLKKRQRAVFLGNRLKDFSNEYHSLRNQKATKDDQICLALGMGFNRSPSTQYDSLTSF